MAFGVAVLGTGRIGGRYIDVVKRTEGAEPKVVAEPREEQVVDLKVEYTDVDFVADYHETLERDDVGVVIGAALILLFLADIFLTVLYARAGTGLRAPHWNRGMWALLHAIAGLRAPIRPAPEPGEELPRAGGLVGRHSSGGAAHEYTRVARSLVDGSRAARLIGTGDGHALHIRLIS